MANINRGYKRFLACGCSHGHLADPLALKKVLEFERKWKPHRRIHLGDFTDQAAFRAGALGTNDEGVSIEGDLQHGLNFLKAFRPTDLLNGNHEIRLWKAAEHHNEILARAASSVIVEIRALAAKLKCQYVEHYDINRSWIEMGNYKLLHGWMFSEQALRDHAEHFSNVIMAHLHKAGVAPGRTHQHPMGYCTGTLANIPAMTYANTRRSTAAWSHGFVYGYFNDHDCRPYLAQCPPGEAANWRLPI